ncbi:hypothetical protein [Delftia acidovorans]|uniref:hypothetical protein n=1 Tax=Delftia acidovorans TaxID=80866 RepID=UPI000BE356E8|nr:hypothetical protein [Delftia acidovorans]
MSFHLPVAARTFFKSLIGMRENSVTRFLLFDAYYACLMIGLDARKLGSESEVESDIFVAEYPEAYALQSDIIAGLLIDAELDRKGIDATDRASVEDEMIRLLNPASATRLSAAGDKLLDLYAAYGIRQILDRMLPPAAVEDFLVGYRFFWQERP